MRFIGDLHIHSKYSRATSKEMTPEGLAYWAQLKGIKVIGTGDFTHPEWYRELKEKLLLQDNGLYRLREEVITVPERCRSDVYFIPTAEISCIYKKGDRTRKIHIVIILPTLELVAAFNARLSKIGNITADGRPIIGFDARKLLEMTLQITEESLVIPAHAWTPHFSIFGAFSGFDSIEECFEDLSDRIYAIETGLSSDPPMNWRLSVLDNITLVSNSDAHSPSKLGREANIFDTDLSYEGIINSIKSGRGFEGTIEFYPEEGKYHFDGHRNCNVCISPEETRKYGYKCPVCGRPVTVGVMHRVEILSDRENGYKPERAKPFYSAIPLQEIIAEALEAGVNTKKVQHLYMKVLQDMGPEFDVLLNREIDDIKRSAGDMVAEGIRRMRHGEVKIRPGFDGEFGRIRLFEEIERQEIKGQTLLFNS
jgi:uncharacterized protein (TIGR00375 family)